MAELLERINALREKGKITVVFEEKGHTYTRIRDGLLLMGVTTIINVRAKEFLKWWTVKEMYKFLLDKLAFIKTCTQAQFEKLLMDGKKAHTRKTKDATDKGTAAHDWCEKHINGLMPPLPEDPQILSAVNAFLAWEKKHEVVWLASELLVWSDATPFAGTCDFLAMVDGKFTLGDFKTSNQISEEAFLQTAAYQLAFEEHGIVPEQRVIVRIPKDSSGFEAAVVPTDLEFDKETFLHLREVYRWNSKLLRDHCDKDGELVLNAERQVVEIQTKVAA